MKADKLLSTDKNGEHGHASQVVRIWTKVLAYLQKFRLNIVSVSIPVSVSTRYSITVLFWFWHNIRSWVSAE